MSTIFTADLHLTDKPADEYRWGIFGWLAEAISKYRVKQVILGGDITDAKDKHSAVLTNRLATELLSLSKQVEVIWVRGNHDYIDENQPFFGFMGKMADITFVTTPTPWPIRSNLKPERTMLLLPNTRNYQEAWARWMRDDFAGFDLIFCHQTFDGCKSESGFVMEGIPPSVFADYKGRVYSGDIHRPQKVGKKIEYVGAPYRIRYNDDFEPRILLIKDDLSTEDLHYPTIFKATIDILPTDLKGKSIEDYLTWRIKKDDLRKGDQLKIRVHMGRTGYAEWPEMKRSIIAFMAAAQIGLAGPELVGIPESLETAPKRAKKAAQSDGPQEALAAYAEAKDLPQAMEKAGQEFLKQAMKD